MSATAEAYMNAFRDIVFELACRAKEYRGHDVGYRTAMMETLGLIKDQATTFGLDLCLLGLADFDPEKWFLKGS
ncbi:MAG TPA: hypothetical protein VHY79_07160 [Rhizomicrobium sp.]|nr:hypothetical protein [Rhizomicrobium sp.]